MNWNNIEKEVALQTESIVNKRSDLLALSSTHTSFDNSFSSTRYSSRKSNSNTLLDDGRANSDIIKVLFNEIAELKSTLKAQTSNRLYALDALRGFDMIWIRGAELVAPLLEWLF